MLVPHCSEDEKDEGKRTACLAFVSSRPAQLRFQSLRCSQQRLRKHKHRHRMMWPAAWVCLSATTPHHPSRLSCCRLAATCTVS